MTPAGGGGLTVGVGPGPYPTGELSGADLEVTGTGEPSVTVLTENGGRLRAAHDPDGRAVLRFPAYRASEEAPTSIVAMSSSVPEWLEPEETPFRFGADVELDARSSGTVHDNGDNVLQRGLFVDPAQFKLQADHHRASCLVRGTEGSALAVSSVTLEPGQWYRLVCTSDDDAVEISVSRLVGGRPVDSSSVRVPADVGAVEFPARTSLTVGGKVGPDGSPAHATDQFNGSIGRAFVTVGDPS